MARHMLLFAGVLLCVGLTAAGDGQSDEPRHLLVFDTMNGVDGPFLDPANAILGVVGDERPWVVGSARGFLDADGHLRIVLRGLAAADDGRVARDAQAPDDGRTLRALVACLSEDERGALVEVKIETEAFAADARGDALLDTRVDLPEPCLAPVVFVMAGSDDRWFAVSGFQTGR